MSPLWKHRSSPVHAAARPTVSTNNRVGAQQVSCKMHIPKKPKNKPRLLKDAGELTLSCLSRKYRYCHFFISVNRRGLYGVSKDASLLFLNLNSTCKATVYCTPHFIYFFFFFFYLANLVSNMLCVLFWVKVPWWILNEAASLSLSKHREWISPKKW